MASVRSFHKPTLDDHLLRPKAASSQPPDVAKRQLAPPAGASRRLAILISSLPLTLTSLPRSSEARERRNRKAIPLEEYATSPDGVKYYDIIEGKGPVAKKGSTVQVHFDCIYRGITAISSRESKLLAGNRIIAQVLYFEFSFSDKFSSFGLTALSGPMLC
ncbi:hypothetical protein BT93_L4854 [Corymbia citriodora subsp. variegata]|uniref:Uncharacterized protein n=1 Tax=Corymbia citriodora subsp. variegata TaxID=360336 RepID=A0A8T0CUV1_CORYI|nr:hypothetical protein BT93_L4854 [Corymbia citriodora subsp. variegata]